MTTLNLTEEQLRVIVEALTQYVDNSQDMDEQPVEVRFAEELTDMLMPLAYPIIFD